MPFHLDSQWGVCRIEPVRTGDGT